jgi:gamma-glutamylcysteine synthetase
LTCSIKTYKIHTNGTDVTFSKRIVRETKQQTRFANTRITNQNQLEEEVTERSFLEGAQREMKKEKWSEDIDSIGFTVGHCNKSTIQGCGGGGDELTNLFVGP